MSKRNFMRLLEDQWSSGRFVSVGLDSELSKIPSCIQGTVDERMVRFNEAIIRATADAAGAYKINSAFYEAEGTAGIHALKITVGTIRGLAPGVPIILDAKRADIGNTNTAYARFAFEVCAADAITVHPYLGPEAMRSFLEYEDGSKGVIVLCRTSNPGAKRFQDLAVWGQDGEKLYMNVARDVAMHWNERGNCALVTGATYPEEIGEIRQAVGALPLLIPGIGKQGGDLQKSVVNGRTSDKRGIIINSSSGIIFASSGEDFARKARAELDKLNAQIAVHMQEAA